MKKSFAALVIVLMVFGAVGAEAQDVKNPVHLRFASLDLGSAWYVYAAAFAKEWRGVLPKGSTIDVLPFAGGIGNALLIDKGDAEIGFLFGPTAKWAFEGRLAYNKKIDALRGMIGGLDRYFVVVMATKRSGITSLEEVAAKKYPLKVVAQPMGSASEYSMRTILEAYGMTYDNIKSWGGVVMPTSTTVAQAQMQDGKMDMWINVVTAGHPAISELAISTDLVFLPMREEIVNKLIPYGYHKAILPAKTFRGQDKDVPVVGWETCLVGHKDLKSEEAYLLTKTIMEQKANLIKAHAGFKHFNPEDAWKIKEDVPLHPGSEKYYREKGMLK